MASMSASEGAPPWLLAWSSTTRSSPSSGPVHLLSDVDEEDLHDEEPELERDNSAG